MSFGVFQSIILGCVVMFFVPFKLQVNIILSLNLLSSVFLTLTFLILHLPILPLLLLLLFHIFRHLFFFDLAKRGAGSFHRLAALTVYNLLLINLGSNFAE